MNLFIGSLLFFVASVLTEHPNNIDDLKNEIRRPQMSALQKFIKVENAFEIPEGISPFDFCNEYRNKTPEEKEETSKNYPEPYPVGRLTKLSLSVENSTGIEVILCVLDIDPLQDFLKLSPVKEDGTLNSGMIFTGFLKYPVKLRVLQATELMLEFGAWTEQGHKHKGFLLSYAPYGNTSIGPVPPPDRKVPFDKLQSYSVLVLVGKKTAETWSLFREFLCNAANRMIENDKLEFEKCYKNNVTIKSIVECPEQLPNSANCVDLTFAISLYALQSVEIAFNPILRESRDPAGLSKAQLEEMWTRYGKSVFSKHGYTEYKIPSVKSTLLLWVGIGFGIVTLALIILVAMCQLSSFRDNWHTIDDDKQNILKNSPEMDMSLFPSPDQVVPPLFPMGVSGYSGDNKEAFIDLNGIRAQENESLRRKSSTARDGALNQGFIDDEEIVRKRPNYRTYVKGVNTDEATT